MTPSMRRLGTTLAAAILVASAAPTFATRTASVQVPTAPKPAGSNVSVLWILLDEAPLWPLLRTDGAINSVRFPGFAALARESTWYRDTLSTAQWTYFAVPSILEGRYPTFKGSPTLEDHPDNLFTALASSRIMDVREVLTTMCPRTACTNRMTRYNEMTVRDQVEMVEGAIARATDSTKPTLHFVHAALPHRPWELTPDMRLSASLPPRERSADPVDRKRDSYQWHLRQYLATDNIIGNLVKRLKASRNWNRTMVIVTADHGLTFSPGESIRDRINTGNPGSMDDVFRVPLFIKYPRQSGSAVSDCTVSSIDILPTVLAAAGVRATWKMDGVDLASQCPRRESRRVRWPGGRADMKVTFEDAVRRVAFYDSWIAADGDRDDIYRIGLSGSLVGRRMKMSTPIDKSISWSLQNARDYRVSGSGRFARVPAVTSGFIVNSRSVGRREEGLIVVDGVVVAVAAEIAGRGPSTTPTFFWSTPNTRLIGPGDHSVELWTATWRNEKPTFRRIGPPRG